MDISDRPIRIRDRSDVSSANLRKPEFLPHQEIHETITKVLIDNLGGKKDEIPSEVARRLGFNVMSSQLRDVISSGLDNLHRNGKVELSEGIFRVRGTNN